MTKRTISSLATVVFKFVFPVACVILAIGLAVAAFHADGVLEALVFIPLIGLTAICFWSCAPLKWVQIEGDALRISDFRRAVSVPLGEIESVTENIMLSIHPVWVSFRKATPFGKKIMFMPTFSVPMKSHPIVDELWELRNKARESSQHPPGA